MDKDLGEQREKNKEIQEKLAKINQQIESLRQQYGVIVTQMEDLIERNAQSPIPNYHEQLNSLMQRRDLLNENIDRQMNIQRIYQNIIIYDDEAKHQSVVSQVERLFNIRITDTASYDVDPQQYGGVPKVVLKDSATLRKEQNTINQKLEKLYYDGQLDLKTYQSMKTEIAREYDKFATKVAKSIKKEQDSQQTEGRTTAYPYSSPEMRERMGWHFDDEEVDSKKTESADKEEPLDSQRKQFESRAESLGWTREQIEEFLGSIFDEQPEQQAVDMGEVVERTGKRFF